MIDIFLTILIIIGGPMTIVILVARPEYILFLYGISIGFPDVAQSVGGAINVRLDDAIILLLFLRLLIVRQPISIATDQIPIIKAYILFWGYCLISAIILMLFDMKVDSYFLIRTMGGGMIFIVLIMSIQNLKSFRFLLYGLALAGIALSFQIFQNFQQIKMIEISKSSAFKEELKFSTWNPNTIGQVCLMLTFSAGLGWASSAGKNIWEKRSWIALAVLFAAIPVFVFARGASIAIFAGWIIVLYGLRAYKVIIALVLLMIPVAVSMYISYKEIIDTAINVDVQTGKGFSNRYELWKTALEIISNSPIIGHGFGQEAGLFVETFGRGMSHNAYLSVTLELGLVGLIIILSIVSRMYKVNYSKLKKNTSPFYLMLVGFIIAICIDSTVGSGLYWEKFTTIAMTIICISIGIKDIPGVSIES